MTSLRTKIRSWEIRAKKLPSYIGWRGSWRKPCLNFRLWLRRSNKIADLRKTTPDRKLKPHQKVKPGTGDG